MNEWMKKFPSHPLELSCTGWTGLALFVWGEKASLKMSKKLCLRNLHLTPRNVGRRKEIIWNKFLISFDPNARHQTWVNCGLHFVSSMSNRLKKLFQAIKMTWLKILIYFDKLAHVQIVIEKIIEWHLNIGQYLDLLGLYSCFWMPRPVKIWTSYCPVFGWIQYSNIQNLDPHCSTQTCN